jgi:hypothetical protein
LKFGVDRTVLSRLREVDTIEELSQMRSEVQAASRLPDRQPPETLFETGEASARALDGCASYGTTWIRFLQGSRKSSPRPGRIFTSSRSSARRTASASSTTRPRCRESSPAWLRPAERAMN